MGNNKKFTVEELEKSFLCLKELQKTSTKNLSWCNCKFDGEKFNDYFFSSEYQFNGKENILFDEKDWASFWKLCKKYFPEESVNGATCIGDSMLGEYQHFYYITSILKSELENIPSNLPCLEIGCGNGGVGIGLLSDNVGYYGIDYALVNPLLKNYPTHFIEIEQSGIPSDLMLKTFNFVYSVNVFQHLTKQQKNDYFKQVYDCLEHGGKFYVEFFMWNDVEFGTTPREGFSAKFFATELIIETHDEIVNMLNNVGFIIERQIYPYGGKYYFQENNPMGFLCVKP
jgi:SAM-dependent methyltransferase